MKQNDLFNFSSRQILTTANDNVFFAVRDDDGLRVEQLSDVTGFKEALLGKRGGVLLRVPITLHHRGPSHPDLSICVTAYVLTIFIADFDFVVEDPAISFSGQMGFVVCHKSNCDQGHFSRAVNAHRAAVGQHLTGVINQCRGYRSAAAGEQPEARQIFILITAGVHQLAQKRGGAHAGCRVVCLDELHGAAHHPAFHEQHFRIGEKGQLDTVDVACDVGHRRRHQHHIPLIQAPRNHAVVHCFGEGVMAVTHGLGVAGGARGIEHDLGVVGIH